MIIIDAPDTMFGSEEEWKGFLAEMQSAKENTDDAEDLAVIERWIEVAERVIGQDAWIEQKINREA